MWTVQKICRVLEVTRSGYYEWVKAGRPRKADRDKVLLEKIKQVERENHGIYGVSKVHQELIGVNFKVKVSRRRVQKIMHDNRVKSMVNLKYKPQSTKVDPGETAFPNLLHQNFTTERRNQVWLADITYVRVGSKWGYLAAVLDLNERKVVGWAIGSNPTAELACKALHSALLRRRPPKGLIHHSDRGCQYTSHAYRKLLNHYEIVGSMSRKGNPYDNAPMESFFKHLKCEWINRQYYSTMQQATLSLSYFIDVYYNCKRLHAALGYKSPNDFANQRNPAI